MKEKAKYLEAARRQVTRSQEVLSKKDNEKVRDGGDEGKKGCVGNAPAFTPKSYFVFSTVLCSNNRFSLDLDVVYVLEKILQLPTE